MLVGVAAVSKGRQVGGKRVKGNSWQRYTQMSAQAAASNGVPVIACSCPIVCRATQSRAALRTSSPSAHVLHMQPLTCRRRGTGGRAQPLQGTTPPGGRAQPLKQAAKTLDIGCSCVCRPAHGAKQPLPSYSTWCICMHACTATHVSAARHMRQGTPSSLSVMTHTSDSASVFSPSSG